jgi:hypothetical protein
MLTSFGEVTDAAGDINITLILISCMFLAVVSTVLDSTNLIVWISNKLAFGADDEEEEEDDEDQASRARAAERVRNPLTNRLITVDGPTHRDLVRRGLLSSDLPADADSGYTAASDIASYGPSNAGNTGWSFSELAPGEGIIPSDGSVAVVRLAARAGGPNGPLVAAAGWEPGGGPFAFEVGDPAVLRGLDAAVRRMREGARAALTLPPPYGYTPARRLPPPLRRPADPAAAAAAAAGSVDMYVDVQLVAVLAMPPALLSFGGGGGGGGGGVVPAKVIQGLLARDPEGRYRLDAGRLQDGPPRDSD